MTAQPLTLTDFLLNRIAEDEVGVPVWRDEFPTLAGRLLAEADAKRRIVEWHKSWPVLVQSQPTFDLMDSGDPNNVTFRASQQIAWTTEQKYREHFGTEPPSGPILRLLALPYADHPDYREEWKP